MKTTSYVAAPFTLIHSENGLILALHAIVPQFKEGEGTLTLSGPNNIRIEINDIAILVPVENHVALSTIRQHAGMEIALIEMPFGDALRGWTVRVNI